MSFKVERLARLRHWLLGNNRPDKARKIIADATVIRQQHPDFIRNLMEFCHMDQSTVDPDTPVDPHRALILEGRRQVGLHVLELVGAPDGFYEDLIRQAQQSAEDEGTSL